MKQTAVEWLSKEISKENGVLTKGFINLLIQHAKEMEKKQIIDAHGVKTESINQDQSKIVTGNQYYNKTFKQG